MMPQQPTHLTSTHDTDTITRADLERLAAHEGFPSISLFMPTGFKGREMRQHRIRLKNLLGQAEEQLSAHDLGDSDRERLMAPMRALEDQNDFWKHQSLGLALFRSAGAFEMYRLPVFFEEAAHVGAAYALRPMLRALTTDRSFYVLKVAAGGIGLMRLHGTAREEISLEDIPQDLDEFLVPLEYEKSNQHSPSSNPPNNTREQKLIHGHGGAGSDKAVRLREYFRDVDAEVCNKTDPRLPLVLAGLDSVTEAYRDVSEHPNLVSGTIKASRDQEQLHHDALQHMEPYFKHERREALARLEQASGMDPSLTSRSTEEVALAARHKRVETLFLDPHETVWGSIDEDSNRAQIHTKPNNTDRDLLNDAARHTLLNGGDVFVFEDRAAPLGDSPAAAVFRY